MSIGEVKEGVPDFSPEEKEHLGQELSDVLLYLVRLSHKCGVDLPQAALNKMTLNEAKCGPTLEEVSVRHQSGRGGMTS